MRRSAAALRIAAMELSEAQILIGVDPRAPAPSGYVRVPGEADRPFTGWLALLSVLQVAIDGLDTKEGTQVEGPGPAQAADRSPR
jgi:hypothetical protein